MYHSQPQQYVPRRIADPRVARLRLELHALVESAAVGLRQLLSKSPHTQPSQNMPTSCYRHVLRCCCIPYIVSGCSVRYCSVKNAEWGFTRAERRTKEDLGAPHTVLSERGQRRTKEAPREDRAFFVPALPEGFVCVADEAGSGAGGARGEPVGDLSQLNLILRGA